MTIQLIQGDCLTVLNTIRDNSVDLVLTDPPYAVTQASWDTLVPIDEMFEHLNRIVKDNGVIVLHCQQPFTTDLINGNRENFRYAMVWDKQASSGHLSCNQRPLQQHEDILVFSKDTGVYNPQMAKLNRVRKHKAVPLILKTESYGDPSKNKVRKTRYTHSHPTTIIPCTAPSRADRLHGHQKPVQLMEYLIKTYSEAGDLVLDCCMGSGSTGVAAIQAGRNFIGIELDKDIFDIAKGRIETAKLKEESVSSLLEF